MFKHGVYAALMTPFDVQGELREDWSGPVSRSTRGAGWLVKMSSGFTDATVMDPDESYVGPKPFARGWGKHGQDAARAHDVWLYNRSGVTTVGRAKLIRYLKRKRAALYGDMPDYPNKEWWNYRPREGSRPKPWVHVDPRRTATPFVDMFLEWTSGELERAVVRALRRLW